MRRRYNSFSKLLLDECEGLPLHMLGLGTEVESYWLAQPVSGFGVSSRSCVYGEVFHPDIVIKY